MHGQRRLTISSKSHECVAIPVHRCVVGVPMVPNRGVAMVSVGCALVELTKLNHCTSLWRPRSLLLPVPQENCYTIQSAWRRFTFIMMMTTWWCCFLFDNDDDGVGSIVVVLLLGDAFVVVQSFSCLRRKVCRLIFSSYECSMTETLFAWTASCTGRLYRYSLDSGIIYCIYTNHRPCNYKING